MIKNRKLSKDIADASWGNFVNLLQYKCDWYGSGLIKVNSFYPLSKTCNVHGWINQDLNFSIRKWTCNNGHELDRDHNASVNILKEGLKIYGQGLFITKVESSNKTTSVAQLVETRAHHVFSVGV